jgi:hypothetical protein
MAMCYINLKNFQKAKEAATKSLENNVQEKTLYRRALA